jgi:hypothetical protein
VSFRFTVIQEENDVSAAPLEADASAIALCHSRLSTNPVDPSELSSQRQKLPACAGMHDDHLGSSAEPARAEPLEATTKLRRAAARRYDNANSRLIPILTGNH